MAMPLDGAPTFSLPYFWCFWVFKMHVPGIYGL